MAAPAAVPGVGGGVGGAGTLDCWQMNCCLGCFGPFEPSRDAIRRDRVGARALNYIEGQVCMHREEWSCAEEPKLTGQPHDSHIFHGKNTVPALSLFFPGGEMESKWLGDNTPGYAQSINGPGGNGQIPMNMQPNQGWVKIKSQSDWRLVFWRHPQPIPGIDALYLLVEDCLRNVNNRARVLPNLNSMHRLCEVCNSFMTQGGTTSNLLARINLHPTPLVPLNAINRYDLNRVGPAAAAGVFTVASARTRDPSLANRDTKYFSYQACLAYYIHRCLPPSPIPLNQFAAGPVRLAEQRRRSEWRQITTALSFILLEIASLMCENQFGSNGGRNPNPKPAYRYKGIIEVYTSYYLWILLCNDIAFGEPIGGMGCDMEFCQFHRYFFADLLEMLVLTTPGLAGAVDIRDVIFLRGWIVGGAGAAAGAVPLGGGLQMTSPEGIIGFLADRLRTFYIVHLRPCFSRHLSGLRPDPQLLIPPPMPAPVIVALNASIYSKQIVVYDMFVTIGDLATLMRLCERGRAGDIDSFINIVGVNAVLRHWNKNLRIAPPRVDRLLEDFMDAWTLHEYSNIMKNARARGGDQQGITPAAAECIYIMCNVISAPMEPTTNEELDLLRQAPRCTSTKGALRLIQVGACKNEEEEDD